MTGPGFTLALQQYLAMRHDQARRDHRPLPTKDELLALYDFVQFCATLDAVEDVIVGDAGTPYAADYPESMHAHTNE